MLLATSCHHPLHRPNRLVDRDLHRLRRGVTDRAAAGRTDSLCVVGYTSGGAPYGLRVCDFDRADLAAMGLDVEALEAAGRLAPHPSSLHQSDYALRNDDVPF